MEYNRKDYAVSQIDKTRMSMEERAGLELHELYRKYGYARYKMQKFEEYELYLKNRDFIETESIIAFSDARGKLMALKPDLTLSIVKNYKYEPGVVRKLFYSENVYRSAKNSLQHREMLQTGLECMGDIDQYQVAEVTMLAAASLAVLSQDAVLAVSHMGLISDLLEPVRDPGTKNRIIRAVGEKNLSEIEKICREEEIDRMVAESLITLIGAYGAFDDVREELNRLPLGYSGRKAMAELETVFGVIASTPYRDQVKIDFSIVNDLTYYSGILFQGFVRGIPQSILSGGRYDRLMSRMNRQGGALGFAVYLDYLDMLPGDSRKNDVDVVLLYGDDDSPEAIVDASREITGGGETILVERAVPRGIRAGRVVRMPGAGGAPDREGQSPDRKGQTDDRK
ncbi:MAG: ATP phosphoribosyltransferase regulatory subunit [Eubacterium pyruvativorans]|uniref:ATP phosphoribosyltransferase regulatory subunit n=1 Tax=Eubacterium pyruvativorans TaxID=155865 RepID=UPI002409AC3F|nr:ATP phosphoribosyltransferase regulatory subunit [Eubacterium pyruvativorans]MDD6707963.1 ATP phosphoribosyltransferase regulatory subunit [Eubacterium pyruvativorans]